MTLNCIRVVVSRVFLYYIGSVMIHDRTATVKFELNIKNT